jgi:hypothetical protein
MHDLRQTHAYRPKKRYNGGLYTSIFSAFNVVTHQRFLFRYKNTISQHFPANFIGFHIFQIKMRVPEFFLGE